jgi:hypothetical protein
MALALVRHQFFGRRATNLLIVLPMATPEIVIGAALLAMFITYNLDLGFTSLLIAHIMFCISFVVVVVRSCLIGFDRSIEEAAADLCSTPLTTSHVTCFCSRRDHRRCLLAPSRYDLSSRTQSGNTRPSSTSTPPARHPVQECWRRCCSP